WLLWASQLDGEALQASHEDPAIARAQHPFATSLIDSPWELPRGKQSKLAIIS
ncbi:hypothetical protein BVRB_033950, partial [Beta vulgaris subsp. vulgaris]